MNLLVELKNCQYSIKSIKIWIYGQYLIGCQIYNAK
jgi:hypothetical protein